MPPAKCKICGTANATCGPKTAHRTIAVDQRIRGVRVAGTELVPDMSPEQIKAALGDMTEEETEEFIIMSQAMAARRARLKPRENGMPLNHTYLAYVRGVDGITRKMTQEDADRYVEMYGDQEGVEIVNKGGAEPPPEHDIIGASKASVGPMFGDDGRQIEDMQPMTTRVFATADAGNRNVVQPGVGVPVTANATPSGSKPDDDATSQHRAASRAVQRPGANEPKKD